MRQRENILLPPVIVVFVLCLLCTSAGAAVAPLQKKPNTVVAVFNCDYSPVSYWDRNTNLPSGFFVDILDRVAGRAGLHVEYICKNDWPEVSSAIERNEADLGTLLKIQEREKIMLFSAPIDVTYLSFFARSQSSVDADRMPEGYTVGVVDGSMSHEQLRNRPGVRLQAEGTYQ